MCWKPWLRVAESMLFFGISKSHLVDGHQVALGGDGCDEQEPSVVMISSANQNDCITKPLNHVLTLLWVPFIYTEDEPIGVRGSANTAVMSIWEVSNTRAAWDFWYIYPPFYLLFILGICITLHSGQNCHWSGNKLTFNHRWRWFVLFS